MSDFLSGFLTWTEDSEPPEAYFRWIGLSCIAAALQKKVWLEWGVDDILPSNLYVVLIGPSGKARKGTAMGFGARLLDDCAIRLAANRVTPERFLQALNRSVQEKEIGGKVLKHSSLTVFSEELTVFLGERNIKFLGDLTDLYDSRKELWSYETKYSGMDHIQNPWLNLLGATAPDWLPSVFPRVAVGGGFTSRIIFVVEEAKRRSVPLPQGEALKANRRRALAGMLQDIASLTGPGRFSEPARQAYAAWYVEQDRLIADGKPPVKDPRFSGYVERRPTHVRKLSLLLSASRGSFPQVEKEDFERAVNELERIEGTMSNALASLGMSDMAAATELVLAYLVRTGGATESQILHDLFRDLDILSFERIMGLLRKGKRVGVGGAKEDPKYKLLN